MRASEIEKKLLVLTNLLHYLVDDSCYSRYILKTSKCLTLKGNIYHGDIEYGASTKVINITFILKKQFKQSCTRCCITVRSL